MMIGHEWARDLLGRAAQRGRLGHAYLLVGPEGIGKTSLAVHLAGLLVCTSEHTRPCGTCRGCRNLARGSHPDVTIVSRAADRRDITIEQIRQLEQELSMAPYEASHKVACVAGADALNDAAASALLKTLEEPPANTTLALGVEDPAALPLTIRSRCQAITLQPVPAHAIAHALVTSRAVDEATARELAALSRGRPGWAVRALAEPEMVERERAARATIARLPELGPYSRLVAIDEWLGKGSFLELRGRALEFVSRLELWWRDALLQAEAAVNPSLRRHLIGEPAAPALAPAGIVAFLLLIQETAAMIEANVAPRLALEHLVGRMPATFAVHHAS